MTLKEQDSVLNRWGNAWFIFLAIFCFGIIAYKIIFSGNMIFDPAYLVGESLVSALVLWGIFYIIFISKRGVKISVFAYLTIFCSMYSGALVGAYHQKQQAVKAISSIQKEVAQVTSESMDSNGMPRRIERSLNNNPQATGEFGEMERSIKEYLGKVVLLRNDYLLEIKAIGWNTILDAHRIKNDTGLVESRMMIQRAKIIVDKYEKKNAALLQDFRATISTLPVRDRTKRAMLEGFDKSMWKTMVRIDKGWELEKQNLLEFENIIHLLGASRGWVIKGKQILFSNIADLDQFNSYIRKIQQITQKQVQIQRNTQTEFNQKLSSLKKMVSN